MARKKHGGKAYRPKPPFITVEGIKSEVYEYLSPIAVWVLCEFYRKFNGYNRQNLSLTGKDVKGKISTTTLSKSIWELVAYGFIDIKRRGARNRECSIYGISGRWKKLSLDEQKLFSISIKLKRLEKIKRIPGGQRDQKMKQRKKQLYERVRIKMLGENWRYIIGNYHV